MSKFCIYVNLDPYLAQWFINDCGGEDPVRLPKGSVESKILEVYLSKRPKDAQFEDSNGKIAIFIPSFRYRPAEVYNYLPQHAAAALIASIRNRFDIDLWNDLHNFGKIGRRQDELIYAWLEKHNMQLTEANWNAVAKRYQRQRDLYLNRTRIKKFREKGAKSF